MVKQRDQPQAEQRGSGAQPETYGSDEDGRPNSQVTAITAALRRSQPVELTGIGAPRSFGEPSMPGQRVDDADEVRPDGERSVS
jgi:hypothetical protein